MKLKLYDFDFQSYFIKICKNISCQFLFRQSCLGGYCYFCHMHFWTHSINHNFLLFFRRPPHPIPEHVKTNMSEELPYKSASQQPLTALTMPGSQLGMDKSTLKVHLPDGSFNVVRFGDATDIKVCPYFSDKL